MKIPERPFLYYQERKPQAILGSQDKERDRKKEKKADAFRTTELIREFEKNGKKKSGQHVARDIRGGAKPPESCNTQSSSEKYSIYFHIF